MNNITVLLLIAIIVVTFIIEVINLNKIKKRKAEKLEMLNNQAKFTYEDMLDAVQYGFKYASESQNDGKAVPKGNIEQWIMHKKKFNPLSC